MVLFALLVGCHEQATLKTGPWRGVINVQGQDLPFILLVQRDSMGGLEAFIENGKERIPIDDLAVRDDSVIMPLYIFDADLLARVHDDTLTGFYIKKYEKDYRLPFTAVHNQQWRFAETKTAPDVDFSGKYRASFFGEADTTETVGIFHQEGSHLEGTFLTTTGDYRYLAGDVVNNILHLSTFDGVHTFLFSARMENDSTLLGDYWSGKSVHEKWIAKKDSRASLPDAGSLTGVHDTSERFVLEFPNTDSAIISTGKPPYAGKVLVVQLMGTWCPNCMDETRFLAPWYTANKDRGVEVIGLDFEPHADFDYAQRRIAKMRDKLGIPYEIMFAGSRAGEHVREVLPMLDNFTAFPTTIFVGRNGRIKAIHTGFSGPGTGSYFEDYKKEFNRTIDQLLLEAPDQSI